MKNTILFLLLASFILVSCKKENTPDETGNGELGAFGCIPTDSATLSTIPILDTADFFNRRLAALPDTFSLDMPPIKSQGTQEGSCVAFACGYAARSYLFHKDQGISYFKPGTNTIEDKVIFSPEYLYNNVKASSDCQFGSNIVVALNFMKTNGISNWNSMPYSPTNGCSVLPNATQLSNGSNFKIQDFYRINNLSTAYLKDVLFQNNPIIIGVQVDDGFWRDGKFIWNSRHGVDIGGHAIVICGWDDNKQAFKIMNSWGTWWGYNGFGWIGYNYLATVLHNSNGYNAFVMQTQTNAALKPNLTVDSVQNITITSATLGGTITSLGVLNEPIIDRGISYNTSMPFSTKTTSTETTNAFKVNVNSLLTNQQYYYWSYASNIYGTTITGKPYGSTFGGVPFKTLANASVPDISTSAVTNITSSGVNTGGNIISNGGSTITASGVCYSTSPNPTTSNSVSNAGVASGTFNNILSSLQSSTKYYARAFATNTIGTGYGNEINFTTLPVNVTIPAVSTTSATSVTNSSVLMAGNVTSTGNATTTRGFCWSITPNPTIANTTSNNGTGIGTYSGTISGLTMGTLYYVRAYTTNIAGTSYGIQTSIITNVLDVDNNQYKAVQIGNQIWMAENLKTTRYKDGSVIPTGLNDSVWRNTTIGAYCIYNNNIANNTTYGKLYNWYAVNTGKLAPEGWHVPTDIEWNKVGPYFGGSDVAGGHMKSISNLWLTPNTGADNSSGFSGLPGGNRSYEGGYGDVGHSGIWWSASEGFVYDGGTYTLSYDNINLYSGMSFRPTGHSVRCIKN